LDKQIQDWTLGEIMEECRRHEECHRGCPIYTGYVCEAGYITGTSPDEWGEFN